jgi:transformation/transcription domain-associated protein
VCACVLRALAYILLQELTPLLPPLLDTLSRLQRSAQTSVNKDLFVELALTVPVRLTHMLPSLRQLMQVCVCARA